LFFTDRYSGTSGGIGIYYGHRIETTPHQLSGDWRLFSMHVMLDAVPQSTDPTTVGRGVFGTVTITPTGSDYRVEGTAQETGPSQNLINITLGGPTANLRPQNLTADDWLDLELLYDNSATPSLRPMLVSASPNMILALDPSTRTATSQTDDAAGMLCMMRKFASAPSSSNMVGTFLVGGHTLFVKPENPGSDAFVGELTLRSNLTWELIAEGRQGQQFEYSGTFASVPEQDGGLDFSVTSGPVVETWRGAISTTYDSLILLDPVAERRTATPTISELNWMMGIRKRTPQ
jgi:hypothetical protein